MPLSVLLVLGCSPAEPPGPRQTDGAIATDPGTPPGPAGDSATPPADTGSDLPELPELPDLLGSCDDVLALPTGTLCALQPSALDPEARDVAGTGPGDDLFGFGWHVVAVPEAPAAGRALWVHFVGTYGRPYDQRTGEVAGHVWLEELMGAGYTVVLPAYDNRWSVNEDCQAPAGYDRDNCAGEIREEVLTGLDVSPFRDTPPADSVDRRLTALLTHLAGHSGVVVPADLDPQAPDWSQLRVSGHSQGGNLAYYVARFRGVDFACMLGAPYDVADAVDPFFPSIADWFAEGTSATPTAQLGQLVTTEDSAYTAFWITGVYLGLREGVEAFRITAAPYHDAEGVEVDGHAAVLADPTLAPHRASACLR